MAFFANTTAADFKKGDIIMFAMGSSSRDRVAVLSVLAASDPLLDF